MILPLKITSTDALEVFWNFVPLVNVISNEHITSMKYLVVLTGLTIVTTPLRRPMAKLSKKD